MLIRDPALVRLLVILASALVLAGNVPILLGIRSGDDAPVPVSWAGWSVLTLVGGWATLRSGHIPSAAFILAESAGCAAIAVGALRVPAGQRDKPDTVFGVRLDLACVPGAVAGLLLLTVARSPLLSVMATVITDLLLFLPTYWHIWGKPRRENPLGYAAFSLGAALILVVTDWHAFTGWGYPVYLAAGDGAACLLILGRRRAVASRAADLAALPPGPWTYPSGPL